MGFFMFFFFGMLSFIYYLYDRKSLRNHSKLKLKNTNQLNKKNINQYIPKMIGKLSLIILIHCVYSLLRYRKYLLVSQEPLEHLPTDVQSRLIQIIVEILFGVVLGLVSILSYTDKFKNLRDFVPVKTYDCWVILGMMPRLQVRTWPISTVPEQKCSSKFSRKSTKPKPSFSTKRDSKQ